MPEGFSGSWRMDFLGTDPPVERRPPGPTLTEIITDESRLGSIQAGLDQPGSSKVKYHFTEVTARYV